MGLSWQMSKHLTGERFGAHQTRSALIRRGFLTAGGGRTEKAFTHIRHQMVSRTANMLKREAAIKSDLAQVVTDLPELLRLWDETARPSVYVYRGNTPMLVSDGDGQNPVAYLCHWFVWQLGFGGIESPFVRQGIIGHKGSYSLVLREASYRRKVVA